MEDYILWHNDLNKNNKHTFENTRREDYNCGGYALGTFTWYRPTDTFSFDFGSIDLANKKNGIEKATQKCVDFMLKEFGNALRVIQSIEDLEENEYAIAFRISGTAWNDFHYIKRAKNGCWYQKQGALRQITRVSKAEVFSKQWISFPVKYEGQIVLLAKKEN